MIGSSLLSGRAPLSRAFWTYAILYGGLANVTATIAALLIAAAGLLTELAVGVFLLPAPYLLAATIGVWRSADAYAGSRRLAVWAKVASVLWAGVLVLI